MINLLLGAPGGGKSYEATVFHILPALQLGRKVVTNLPLDVEAFCNIDASFRPLIELRTGTSRGCREDGKPARVFAHVDDYADDWRHPEKHFGPLFVIDECHFALPDKSTSREVEEWFSMHRHFNVDVLLITQSYGKISMSIRDLVQTVYRVRKNVALGSPKSYTRKVQDGIRGEVLNTSIRSYQKKYFGLYRSHTQGQAVEEFNASDVKPLWKHWTFQGAALCALFIIGMAVTGNLHSPFSGMNKALESSKRLSSTQSTPSGISKPAVNPSNPDPVAINPPSDVQASSQVNRGSDDLLEPFGGIMALHLTGSAVMGNKRISVFTASQNGQAVATYFDYELRKAGYKVEVSSPCIGVVTWKTKSYSVTCDLPTIGASPGNINQSRSSSSTQTASS